MDELHTMGILSICILSSVSISIPIILIAVPMLPIQIPMFTDTINRNYAIRIDLARIESSRIEIDSNRMSHLTTRFEMRCMDIEIESTREARIHGCLHSRSVRYRFKISSKSWREVRRKTHSLYLGSFELSQNMLYYLREPPG